MTDTLRMMRTTRPLLSAMFALLLTLTGLATGMAQGGMAADGIWCGYGDTRVMLADDGLPLFDAAGDPVEIVDPPCLDCVIGALALPPATSVPIGVLGSAHRLAPVAQPGLFPALWRLGGHGRSPPRAA